jgi:lysophospholipase L1-like esterase
MKKCFQTIVTVPLLITALILTGCDEGVDTFTGDDDDILYVAIGASDALGVGAIPKDEGYVFRIEDRLDAELEGDVELCIPLCLVALPAAELNQIKDLLDVALDAGVDPDIVTILVGPNDIIEGVEPEDFQEDLRDVLNRLIEESPNALIVIANVPDLTQLPRFDEGEDSDVTLERIREFNEVIEILAGEFNLPPVVNLFGIMITDDFVADDGFHPSAEGHQIIAELFLDVILAEFDPS